MSCPCGLTKGEEDAKTLLLMVLKEFVEKHLVLIRFHKLELVLEFLRTVYIQNFGKLSKILELADKLLADVTEPFHLALILGPKGIGKTMFLNYLIVRIVEKERAAQSLQTLSIVYLHSLSTTTDQGIRFTSQGVSINSDGAEYFLSDSLDICDGTLGNKLLLEVASESQGNYKNFSVRLCEKNGERIVMDVWSLAELEQVFGGRVRQVLGGISDAPEVLDSIETTARWFFGLALKEAFPKSWNRALQIIRNTIKDAQGKTSKEELAITTSLFWIVHGTGGT
eukprot:gene37006-48292_t